MTTASLSLTWDYSLFSAEIGDLATLLNGKCSVYMWLPFHKAYGWSEHEATCRMAHNLSRNWNNIAKLQTKPDVIPEQYGGLWS